MYDLSFDQAGCRRIQQLLEDDASSDFVPALVRALAGPADALLPDVMANQFGNYLCQKIIEVSAQAELRQIVRAILPHIFEISTSVHGTRAMQTLAEVVSAHLPALQEEIALLTGGLAGRVVELSTHAHGNHVIQAILVAFRCSDKPSDGDAKGSAPRAGVTQFIFDACMRECKRIGMHKHGCCVMQRCLEKGALAQKLALADVIIAHLAELIEDPFGNYLVQNVLKLRSPAKNEMIFAAIARDFVRLSQLKFSSNVLEKCLESENIGRQVD